ncbi:hypothetical protein [Neorhizobium huautlense]|uniref:hypothetical protein n=1 Tax=Neorhizobium huautlense TaxID=67774 RepID=UPI0013005E42|nr:hypothetical protein [Neorhizobium huautlense]
MANKRPFLGTTTDPEKAFPGEDFEVLVMQDKYGMYSGSEASRTARYSKATVPRVARCLNPRCQQGGIDLQMQVMFAPKDGSEYRQTYSCNGHEGSPAGRRKGDPCMNTFDITITKRSSI